MSLQSYMLCCVCMRNTHDPHLSSKHTPYTNRHTPQQTAKVAYESAAPSVVTKCQQLLRQRDILQVSLFSTFAISGDALQRMVTLRPDVEVASDNHSGKLPTDLSLPFNPESPSAGSSPYAEPQASYAPPAYLNKGTPSPGAMSTSTGVSV